MWDDLPPDRADETIARYVGTVRRALSTVGASRDAVRNHRPRMYSLDVPPGLIDYHVFAASCAAARAAGDDSARAITAYRAALACWTGEALSGIPGGWADARRHALHGERDEAAYALCEQLSLSGDPGAAVDLIEWLARHSVPTDRMILAGMRFLQDANQRSLIPSFLDRLASRMIKAADVRPGPAVYEAARRAANGGSRVVGPAESARPAGRRVFELRAEDSSRIYQAGRIIIFNGPR